MFYQIAAIARDVSVILLVLEAMILLAVPLFVLLKITQGLRKLKPHVTPFFRKVQGYLTTANRWVQVGSSTVAKPFVWLPSTRSGVQVSASALKRALSKEN